MANSRELVWGSMLKLRNIIQLGLGAAAILVLEATATAHEHLEPDGTITSWYPKECCDDRDCRPVAHVRTVSAGLWMTTTDGFTILVGPSEKRRPSRDMRWHICVAPDDVDNQTPRVTCIFEPPSS